MKHAIFILMALVVSPASAQQIHEGTPKGEVYVYKKVDGANREIEIYFPKGHDASKSSVPGIILFHGGGWGGGSRKAFSYQCNYFASRGMVAATVTYRLRTKADRAAMKDGQSTKRVCIPDVKSAIRWFKQHAKELGVDPKRIVAGGGSAGGHISLLGTTNPGLNDPTDPQGIDTSVAAYVLFNPALSPSDAKDPDVDFLRHLKADFGPAIVFFGSEDKWLKNGWTPAAAKMKSLGITSVEMHIAEGQKHAFFNKQPWKDITLIAADKFLTKLGYLKGEPSLSMPESGKNLVKRPLVATDPAATNERRLKSKRNVSIETLTRPNILLLYADDQRNHTLGCAGHPIVKTPNIDRLAKEGVRFENAFVSTSTCWVGRACLFTSTYERRHLYRSKAGALDSELCETSFFAVLKNAGYRTGHLGKEHVKIDAESADKMWDVREKIGRRPYFKKMEDGSTRHETQILGDWGIDFIKEQPVDQPFCLQISFNATHAEDGDKRPGIGHFPWPKVTDGMYEDQEMPLPALNDPAIYVSQPDFLKKSINRQRFFWRWDTPEKYQTNMRAYFRMLSGIDHVVGRLVEQLEEQGLANNTVIVYTADNGYYLGDRGFAGKWTHYDQSLRVPLVVYDPRLPKSDQGRVLQEMALNSDIGSTLIEMAGLPTPDTHTGRSLAPLLRGDSVSDWRTDFLCEFLAVPGSIPRWEGVRGQNLSYARYFVDGNDQVPQEFLYDLREDPDQLVNLAAAKEAHVQLKQMRERTDALIAENGPAMQDIGNVQRPSGKTKK